MNPSRDDRKKEALEWAMKGFSGFRHIFTAEGGKRNQEAISLWTDIAMYDNYSNLHYPGGREAWLQQLKDAFR
jgi:hypothetical protein